MDIQPTAAVERQLLLRWSRSSDLVNPRMAEPAGALDACVCGDHVGRPNVLFHLAGRAIQQARQESFERRHRAVPMDGPQRWLLHGQPAEITQGRPGAGPLVPLGSAYDLGERYGSPGSCVLLQQWTR